MFGTMLFTLAFLQPPMPPPPPPDIQVAVKGTGKIGRYLALQAQTTGTVVLWKAIDPGIDFLDPTLSPSDTKTTGVIADNPGTYRLMAITSVKDKPALTEFAVTFEGKKPPPPPPTPPPTPTPVDPLVAKLQAAFDRDTAATNIKSGHRTLLVGFYEAMSEHAKSTSLKTSGDLLNDMKTVSAQMVPASALVECRKIVAAEITASIGSDPASLLDPNLRPTAVGVFSRIAKSMAEVK